MQLLALAGGDPTLGMLAACFLFVLVPLVVLLSGLSAFFKSFWPAVMALIFAGLFSLLLWLSVADVQPSDDWELTGNKAAVRRLAGWCLWLVAIAGVSLIYVGWMRQPKKSKPNKTL